MPLGTTFQVIFEASGDLLTSGGDGVQRWPVQLDSDQGQFRIGPPLDIPFSSNSRHVAEDKLGRIIATPRKTYAEVQVSDRSTEVGPLDDCRYVKEKEKDTKEKDTHCNIDIDWRFR